MRANLYLVDVPRPGRLATMARPRGGAWLPDEMAALREAGVDVLVSALCEDECDLLDLRDEAHAARAAGLEFISFPFVDTGIPAQAQTPHVALLADRLAEAVQSGLFVVTHCRAGIGRSSILAGTVLVRLGLTAHEAWRRIRTARGYPVPDNAIQEAWLHTFAGHVRSPTTPAEPRLTPAGDPLDHEATVRNPRRS